VYNRFVDSPRFLPNRERLSAVMAMILLVYTAARFVQLPEQTLGIELAGIYLPLQVNINTLVAILVAALTASGTDWLLRDDPALQGRRGFRHWLLPSMTAWVLSLPLANLEFGLQWWAAFAASAVLLLAILVGEYTSAAPENRLHDAAKLALTALSYALFLILAISVRGVALRLYLALPAIAMGALMISTRIHLLRTNLTWQPVQSFGIAFVIAQLAAALHYFPISALSYGLVLLGAVFALNQYAASINLEQDNKQAIRESLIILGTFWFLAILVR
jgi:hypothetical protein